jgi:PAS domain S-box-containing protein
VLIVEDHEENRNLLRMLLQANGYRVTAAGDGLEALAAARRDPPDVIVSDVLMPKLDGFGLCRAWMGDARLKVIPFIFYSATNVRAEDEEFGLTLGAARYLIKPLEAKVLLEELSAVLRERTGPDAPAPSPPLDDAVFHTLHEMALTRKLEDKIAQLETANRKLRENEARFRSLTEMSSDFYWESDAEHRLTLRISAGKESSTVSPLVRGTQIGQRRWEIPFLSPDESGWQAHRALLDAHQPFREFEISRLGTDGMEHFVSISGDPVFDASGAFQGYRGVGKDITERVRRTQDLERLRLAIDTTADSIYLTDPATMRFVEVNNAACRRLGYTREQLLKMGPQDVLVTDRAQLKRSYDEAIAAGEQGTSTEMHYVTSDGGRGWTELHRRALRSGNGWLIVTLGRDITERKRTESALRESEARYRTLFESMLNGFAYCQMQYDDQGRPVDFVYLDVNNAFQRLTGLQNVVGRKVSEVIPGIRDLSPELFEIYGRVASTGTAEAFEFDFKSLAKWLTISVYSPGTGYFVAIFDDITERKRSEEALRAAEEQYRGLVEQSIAGTYIIQDGKLAYVNPRYIEILGYHSADELIGRDVLSLVSEKDRDAVAEQIRRRIEGDVANVKYEHTAVRADGSTVDIGVHGSRASYRGRPAIIGLVQDISEKKRAEEEIELHVAKLENAFTSTVKVITNLGEMRDPYTAGHQRRVAEIAVAIGAELGFDARRQDGLRFAGYLHDIGKIRIPSEILSKPGKLSPTEFRLVQGHAQASYDVLKDVNFPWPVAEVALQHHERMDGSGYPQNLKGEAILLEARIMAVADVVEAMSSHRPYRPGLGIEAALAEIDRGRGTAYDPDVADACLKVFRYEGYSIPA